MPATTCWLLVFILSAIVTDIKGQCGNDTTQTSYVPPSAKNFFFSPDYPDPYPSNISCRWLLETNDGYRLRLKSTQFQLRTSNRSCVDIFRVYDGDSLLSPVLYSSCNETFQPINSSSRYLLITFTSGSSDSESEGGFLIIYESLKYIVTTSTSTITAVPTTEAFHCGVNNLTAEAGTYGYITSPGFPNAYPNDATCTWSIMANNSSFLAVRLDIVRIDLEISPNCSFDSITIYDVFPTWREEVRRICSYLEEPVVSRGLYLLVVFTSDSAFSGRGFQLRYTSVAKPPLTSTTASTLSTSTLSTTTRQPNVSVCSSTPVPLSVFSGEVKYLQSPGYPIRYYNNFDCHWRISAGNNFFIKVTVEAADLHTCIPCGVCDFLAILDGQSTWDRSLGKVCNTDNQTVFYSTGPYMYLTLRTHMLSRGFRLRYEAVNEMSSPTLAGTLSTSTLSTTTQPVFNVTTTSSIGSVCSASPPVLLNVSSGQVRYLQSPNYPNNYFNHADCHWQMSTDNNFVIKVTVETANLEACQCGNCDFLEIFDGQSISARSLAKVCIISSETEFFSTGPYLYLRLSTDQSIVSTGFRLRYEAVAEMKSPTPASTLSTTTRRPVFSETTPSNARTLSTTTRRPVFSETTPSSDGTVCLSTPVSLTVSIGQVRYLQSPNYPNNYFNNADCQWRISTGTNLFVKVRVEAANLEQCMVCGSCDFLEIFDGTSSVATKLGTVCDTNLQTMFYSSGPELYLRLRTDTSIVSTGFRLRYEAVANISSLTPVCDTTTSSLTSSFGKQKLIKFESYANQGRSQVCKWIIWSDAASRVVRVSFDHFNLQYCSRGDCVCGFLDIYDGVSEFSPRLARLCGAEVMPLMVISTSNSLYLTFNSGGSWYPKTFALQYESLLKMSQSTMFPRTNSPTTDACSAHPVRLKAMNSFDRLLASPRFPTQHPVNTHCDWLITSEPGYVIMLTTFTVNLESCRDCNCQRIDIFDGPANYSNKLLTICNSFTDLVTSTGQMIFIRFSTNAVVRQSGFSLLYRQVLQSAGVTDSSISKSEYNLKLTALVGGILGFTLLVVVLAFIFFLFYKRLSRKQKQIPKTNGNTNAASNHSPLNHTEPPTNEDEETDLTSAPLTSPPPTSASPSSAPPTSAPPTSVQLISPPPTSTSPTRKQKQTPKTRGKKKAASNHISLNPTAPPTSEDEDTDLTSTPPTSDPFTSAPSTSFPLTSAPSTSAPLTFAPPTTNSPTRKQKQTTKTLGKKRAASNHIPLNPTAPPANNDEDTDLTSAPPTSGALPSSPPTFAPPTSQRTSSLYPNLSYINQENHIQAERSTGGALASPPSVPLARYPGRDNPAFTNDSSTVDDDTAAVSFAARGHSDV